MRVITCDSGAMRGIWFESEADLDTLVTGNPDIRPMPMGWPQFFVAGEPFGFPCRVATAEQWALLRALAEPAPPRPAASGGPA